MNEYSTLTSIWKEHLWLVKLNLVWIKVKTHGISRNKYKVIKKKLLRSPTSENGSLLLSTVNLELKLGVRASQRLRTFKGESSHKDSNTVESLISLKRTCKLLIYPPSQWHSCMSRPSRSTLALVRRWMLWEIDT